MTKPASEILIVDDDTDFAESLADLLELQGHSLTIATDGKVAVQLARERRFDLVFLDIKMPGIDGVETLRRLREVQEGLKIVVVTGYATTEQLDDAVAAGAFSVLEKPCSIEQLLDLASRAECEQIILVADDDPDFTKMLVETLSTSGRRVLTANKAMAALDLLEEGQVNVLLLDMRLPETDGYAVLAALKERSISTPVIVVTAYPFEDDHLSSFEGAVAEVLRKPVPTRRLIEAINKAANEKPRDDIGRSP